TTAQTRRLDAVAGQIRGSKVFCKPPLEKGRPKKKTGVSPAFSYIAVVSGGLEGGHDLFGSVLTRLTDSLGKLARRVLDSLRLLDRQFGLLANEAALQFHEFGHGLHTKQGFHVGQG